MTKKALPRPKSSNLQVSSYVKAVKKGLRAQHVVPTQGGWAVKRAGTQKASKIFSKQTEAFSYATKVAKNNRTEVYLHSRDGRIRERNSFSPDPFPPLG